MNFEKFHAWKRSAVLVSMANSGVAPGECAGVYKRLLDEGLITPALVEVTKVTKKTSTMRTAEGFVLTDAGKSWLPIARREATKLLSELVRENEKLVHKIVNQLYKATMSFTEEEDLYQEGLRAFCKSLEKFDPTRFATKGLGASWCTYLRHWIRDYVQKGTAKQQPIKHPKGFGMPYSVFRRVEEIHSRTGSVATAEQLGTYTVRGKEVPITEALLVKWRTSASLVVPLDELHNISTKTHWDSGGHNEFIEVGTAPDSSKNPETMYERAEQEQLAAKLIDGLTSQEKEVLTMMREGDASNRKVAGVLGCKDECARLFKAALIVKLQKRAGWAA